MGEVEDFDLCKYRILLIPDMRVAAVHSTVVEILKGKYIQRVHILKLFIKKKTVQDCVCINVVGECVTAPVLVRGWVTSLLMSRFSEDRRSRTMSGGSMSRFLARNPLAL